MRYTTPTDRVYLFHNEADDLLEMDPRFCVISARRFTRPARYLANRFALLAGYLRIVGCLRAKSHFLIGRTLIESAEIVRVSGALRNHFVVNGFFQNSCLREIPIRIKPELVAAAKARLRSMTRAGLTVGVHIRLTDYGSWSVLGAVGALILASWYRDRMNQLRKRVASPTFVVFSDDIGAAKKLNLGDDVVFFYADSPLEDFTALALCDHAIISPSTFAWWAVITYRSPEKIVMAPMYWAGFKTNTWFPPSIATEGIEYYPAE